MQKHVTVPAPAVRAAPPRHAGPRGLGARGWRGFTLMEVLTIVALLSLMAILSVGAVGPLRDRMRRQETFEQLVGALVRARMAAQETGDCYFVELANNFDYNTKEYSGFITGVGVGANYLVIRRMSYANCTPNPPADALTGYPVTPDPRLSVVEAVAAPFASPERQPQVRVFQGRVMVTVINQGSAPVLPLIFRPNGRVRGRNVDSAVRFYITSPNIPNPTADRRVIVRANGRICIEDDMLAGGTRCY